MTAFASLSSAATSSHPTSYAISSKLMAYDESLAERVRLLFDAREGVEEKKMFGGLAFLLNGNMCCGIVGDELMVRVGPDQYDQALKRPHARPMDFTGRPMRGMVYVDADGLASEADIKSWVEAGLGYAESLQDKRSEV